MQRAQRLDDFRKLLGDTHATEPTAKRTILRGLKLEKLCCATHHRIPRIHRGATRQVPRGGGSVAGPKYATATRERHTPFLSGTARNRNCGEGTPNTQSLER